MRIVGLAAALLSASAFAQCATGVDDNSQVLCGVKSFDRVVVAKEGVLLDGPYAFLQSAGGRAVYMRDSVPAASSSPSFFLQTQASRTGPILHIRNQDELLLTLDPNGALTLHKGQFRAAGGHSGDYAMLARQGGYLPIAGTFPPNYWGHHGAVQVANETRMSAGFPFEVYNALSTNGAATDHIFFVAYRGSIATQADVRSTNINVCDGNDVNPDPSLPSNRYTGIIPDGGVDWYAATDAGHSMAGEIFLWVSDVGESCQCVPAMFDGGRTSSWRKLSDRQECKP